MVELATYEIADGVATVTLDDGKVNVLSLEMLSSIGRALDRAIVDEAVVVLTGRPGVFSGGFDLKVLRAGGPDAVRMLESGFELSLRMLEHPTPIVVACTGHAVAMGAFVLLSADYRIGVDGPYRLVANEVAIGMTLPFSAIEICRQRLTPAAFVRAVTLAETFSPRDAVAAGFLDRVVDEDGFEAEVAAVANGLASLSRAAHAVTKARARSSTVEAIRAGMALDQADFRGMDPQD